MPARVPSSSARPSAPGRSCRTRSPLPGDPGCQLRLDHRRDRDEDRGPAAAARAVRLHGRRRDGRLRRAARAAGVRPHAVLVHDSTMPGWLRNGSWSRASLLAVLEQHITAVMTHFRGRVAAWDVVNEALNDDGTRRNCLWKRVIGDDWVEQAFRFARRADPGAKLFYNETHADVPNPKYEATLSLVRDLRERGVPVDGVGLQYHLTDRMPTRAQVEEAIAPAGRARRGRPHQRAGRARVVPGQHARAQARAPGGGLRHGCGRVPGPAGLLPHHDLGLHGPLHLAPALEREPPAAVRCRVRAEAGVAGDPGGAASNGPAASASSAPARRRRRPRPAPPAAAPAAGPSGRNRRR